MKKENIKDALYIPVIIILLWIAVTNTIQAFKCPKMTRTELFLTIPNSFMCDWQDCEDYLK